MNAVSTPPILRVSKKALSMFLRTRCDKELFFSLHDAAEMPALGLPEPIKRPGIGILAIEGRDFEAGRNDQIAQTFPAITHCAKNGAKYCDIDLKSKLLTLTVGPALILQGRFSVQAQHSTLLARMGLSTADIAVIPPLTDFIPDVVFVRPARVDDFEVCANGTRMPVDPVAEKRLGLCVIDIKHTSEANPSYCSEIAMYALMLANWIEHDPQLRDRYYVATQALLWTRASQGKSSLDSLIAQSGASQQLLLEALLEDAEDAQLRFYLAAIRGFFEDVARVVRIGQSGPSGWSKLDWHVASTCASCDWLGDKRHMGTHDRTKVDAQPSHYCMTLAQSTGHLSLVPGVTRGAKKVLCMNAVGSAADLAAASGHPVLQQHTLLKREAKTLPARSLAITTATLTRDQSGVIASLVASANLLLYASVNFDSSSGLLTGLALSGVATAFQAGQAPRRFRGVPFVVDEKTLAAEWVALEGFLTQIAGHVASAESLVTGSVTGQIHFWENRQFKELCNAMGRHLPRVLALSDRKAKALAWIFTSDDMIARPDALNAATVVTVDDIVRRLVFAPTPHVITLFDTVEHYNHNARVTRDAYYREYLTNGIPRERIYEIWSNAQQIKRGPNNFPRNTVISQFSDALIAQCSALESVCEQLRKDYGGRFRAKATHIPVSIPQGARGVAFDSKLWLWWDELNFSASQLESHIKLSMDGERLEASYEAILLSNGSHVSGEEYEFQVAAGSREAKFKEESLLTLGKLGQPGMPLQRVSSLLAAGAPPYSGDLTLLTRPFWSLVDVRLLSFDRKLGKARVRMSVRNEPLLVPYLILNAAASLLDDVFLIESKRPAAFNWAKSLAPILEQIGQPKIAVADRNAAKAMGITPPVKRGAGSPETPASQVLWQPAALQHRLVIPIANAQLSASAIASVDGLNVSQESAVAHGIAHGLTLIWGPPGTGKTNTLAAMLHSMVKDASAQGQPLRVLVTGPTYKAVEEVLDRAIGFMSKDTGSLCNVFMGYSEGRSAGGPSTGLPGHINYQAMFFSKQDPAYQACVGELQGSSGVTIVGCHIRQSRRFPDRMAGASLSEIFDIVIIDESSQVPVSHAIAAFSGLKKDGRLIIAGDHLQMPPIVSIEAPAEAAYLVGSIQTYLTRRPFAQPVGRCVLERNYRSNEHIVEFARNIGYPATLTAEYPDTSLSWRNPLPAQGAFPSHLPWCADINDILCPEHKAVTVLHQDDISSQGNHYEARIIASLAWMLRHVVSKDLQNHGGTPSHGIPSREDFWGKCLGIVTPHRAQRALVIQELEALWPLESNLIAEAVDTVERFQGGQRHTIIVSFGVADVDVIGGEEAFLMQLERTNVAVSRAMAKCIVVMPDALAAHIPEDKRALQTAFALKDYIEEFCNKRVTTDFDQGGQVRGGQIRFHS